MTGDDGLRPALDAVAEPTGDPGAVRPPAAGRIRAQRRRLLTVGAAAIGAAAVGLPAALWLTRRSPAATDVSPPAPGPNLGAPLRLRPTWLPDGVSEWSRMVAVGGGAQLRMWTTATVVDAEYRALDPNWQTKGPVVLLAGYGPLRSASSGPASSPTRPPYEDLFRGPANMTVGGRPARSWEMNGTGNVAWLLDDAGAAATLGVDGMADAVAVAERVAAGMVPDGHTMCETALRFGTLPASAPTVPRVSLDGYPGGWLQGVVLVPTADRPLALQVILTSERDTLGDLGDLSSDPTISVLGRTGRVRKGSKQAQIVVELDRGRWLVLIAGVDDHNDVDVAAAVTATAEALSIGPDPDLSWLGRR
jgi:hypothetical protein